MKSLIDQLAKYAAYHRDRRNIALHLVGIPLIVASVDVLLSRATFAVGSLSITPAILLSLIVGLYYLRLDLHLGLAMALLLAGGAWLGKAVGTLPHPIGIGVGLFVIGWIIQFVGHAYEGRKPAFVDDLVGLLIGPLFVVAEIGFLLGLRRDLEQAIEERAGPKRAAALFPTKS